MTIPKLTKKSMKYTVVKSLTVVEYFLKSPQEMFDSKNLQNLEDKIVMVEPDIDR